jgi:transcriptional regulator with XRE-family HTH domain
MHDFPTALRRWRRTRRLSQLDLASEAEVSPSHLAFLETGRSRPSRAMVLRLAGVLTLPPVEQNGFLAAAGFAPQFPSLPLGAAEMAQVRQAMDWTIDRHAPYPALILDRLWRIVALNGPAQQLFGPAGFAPGASLLDALCDPVLFPALIENWVEVGHHTALRLRAESARAGGIAELDRAVATLLANPAIAASQPQATGRAVLATIYRMGDQRLPFFSTYAQFGAAEEVALSDMKIELMFPADDHAKAALLALAS